MVDKVYRKNPKTYEDEISGVVNDIDQSQLKASTNDVNVRDDFARDMKPEEFTGGIDRVADESADANPELEKYPETERFAKEHQPIDENAIKKGMGLKEVKSGGGTN